MSNHDILSQAMHDAEIILKKYKENTDTGKWNEMHLYNLVVDALYTRYKKDYDNHMQGECSCE